MMNMIRLVIIALVLSNCGSSNSEHDTAIDIREFYQLKIYSFSNEQQEQVTEQYLKAAYVPALKKLGVGQVGIFKNRKSDTDSSRQLFILLPFSSLDQFEQTEHSLNEDTQHQTAGSDYLNAPFDNPPYARISTILLRAFAYMPKMLPSPLTNPRTDRIYELRSYESATEKIFGNKMDMFNAGGEITLFDKLKFNAVFYGEVIAGPKMPNLMYMTTHTDSIGRALNWKNFVDSPEWKEMSAIQKYQNSVSHIDITFLYPTEYSDY